MTDAITTPPAAASEDGVSESESFDVVILGGGLAGLSLALHLRRKIPTLRTAVLERRSHPVPEAAHKVGESSVEVAAEYFSNVLGLKDHILEAQLPKLGLRFILPRNGNERIEERLELGGRRFPPSPSYQLDRGRFENYLGELCRQEGICFRDGAKVREVTLATGMTALLGFGSRGSGAKAHIVSFSDGSDRLRRIRARWVVDASGRASILKRRLGLAKESPHRANAAWFRIGTKINIDDWCTDPAWRHVHSGELSRWFSTNHLMGEGYWVWLIPLGSGSTSVGIVADDEIHPLKEYNTIDKALSWLERHEPQCAEKIRPHLGLLQDFLAMKQYPHDCRQVFSANRWALTGEAGVFLDPFYSPGSDFIAFSNTFICDLIERDFAGKSILAHAPLFDQIYKAFYRGTAVTYQDKYRLFGNHQVMPVKVLWDYIIYWTLTGFMFFHQRTCDPLMYVRNIRNLRRINQLNHCMQDLFLRWHATLEQREIGGCINMSAIPFIFQMNSELQEDLSNSEYNARFALNRRRVEELFWHIVDEMDPDATVPLRRPEWCRRPPKYFAEIFHVTKAHLLPDEPVAEPPREARAGGAR